MRKIKIVCDTMSDLSKDICKRNDIEIIPTTLIFENKEYKSGIDMNSKEFYELLRNSDSMASTSQIPYVTYKETFEKYVSQGYSILYLCGSSAASGTFQSASLAKNDIDGDIHIVDTYSLSIGGGILIKKALDLLDEGKTLEEIKMELEESKKHIKVFFSVSSLEYLQKGGRISGAKAAVGTILNIIPILKIEDGLVKHKTQVRGMKKVLPALIESLRSEIGEDFSNKDIYIGCGDEFDQRDKLVERIKKELKPRNVFLFDIGPCVGAHSGPSVLGVACLNNSN